MDRVEAMLWLHVHAAQAQTFAYQQYKREDFAVGMTQQFMALALHDEFKEEMAKATDAEKCLFLGVYCAWRY